MTLSKLSTSGLYTTINNAGITGYGNWASVTAQTGATLTEYNDGSIDWYVYTWTSSGSVTLTSGVVDVLVVGGGGGAGVCADSTVVQSAGGGGGVTTGLRNLSSSTHTVTVGGSGAGGSVNSGRGIGSNGGWSALGSYIAGGGGGGLGVDDGVDGTGGAINTPTYGGNPGAYFVGTSNSTAATAGSGAGGSPIGANKWTGFVSTISGNSIEYGIGGQPNLSTVSTSNTGQGGNCTTSIARSGGDGIVVIRVPKNPNISVPLVPQAQTLPGVGGWATVTATTGSPTTATYTDASGVSWKYYQWTGAGSVTVTAGVVDALVVGGGSGNFGSYPGNGGYVRDGLHALSAGTSTVTVGSAGNGSTLGSLSSAGAAVAYTGNQTYASVSSAITGSSVTYSLGSGSTYGSGQTAASGIQGTVIIRVPVAYAQA